MTTGLVLGVLAGVALGSAAIYTVHNQNMASKTSETAMARQNDATARQLEMGAQAEKTQAEADELERQRTLSRILAAQNAVFGSSGLDMNSGSFSTVRTVDSGRAAEATRLNQMFVDTRQVGFKNNIRNLENQTAMTRQAAKIYRRTNTINAFNSQIKLMTSI